MTRSAEDEGARRTRRRDGEERRGAILDAALRCYERQGLFRVGIEDIRREAGASPSSVYHLFGDLDGIVAALLARVFEALFAHLAARLSRTRTAEGAVRALVDGHIDWIAAHPVEGRLMYQAMTIQAADLRPAARDELAAAKARALAPILAAFAPHIERGDLPAWSPTFFDVTVLGVAHEALRRWLGGAEELAPALLKKRLPALAWKAIRPGG